MPIRWAFLKRVLAGAVFGVYMTHLLYFLNPQVDITPLRLALVITLYGILCGLAFGAFLWLLRVIRVRLFGKPETERYRAHGFGFVVLAAFAAAAIYWMQRQVFFIYLPIGAQRSLAKATNLITVIAFVLLLMWVVERNASRRQSRIILILGVVLIAFSSFFLYQRQDEYHAPPQRVVVADVGTVAGQRPLIVIAIRNLPYDWILTLAGEGSLPFFDEARAHGYLTRLEPFPTTGSQALWASLETGKLPFRHGVTGEYSYASLLNGFDKRDPFIVLPSGIGFQSWQLIPPVERVGAQLPSGRSLPLWTLFQRVGLPAEKLDPPSNLRGINADRAVIAQLRGAVTQHPLTIAMLRGFEDAQRDVHIFANALPPRSSLKGEIVRSYVAQLDALLGSVAREFPNHLILVTSPSGPVPPKLPATPFALVRDFVIADDPGADDGFVLITGNGVVHRERPAAAQSVDVVPTALYAAGLPVGRDMDGRVLSDAFADDVLRQNPLRVVQTYEANQIVVRRGGA